MKKVRCEHLITDSTTSAEIWMSRNLISDDTSLWGLNMLQEISDIKKYTKNLGMLIMPHVHNLSRCLQAKLV